MAKTKNPPKSNRKLTEYFTPRSSSAAPSSSQPRSSPIAGTTKHDHKEIAKAPAAPERTQPPRSQKNNAPLREDQESASVQIIESSPARPFQPPLFHPDPAFRAPASRYRTRASVSPAPPALRQHSADVPLLSNGLYMRSRSHSQSKPASKGKRKNKFDDEGVEVLDTIIEVPRWPSCLPTETAPMASDVLPVSGTATVVVRSPLRTKDNRITPPRSARHNGSSSSKKPRLTPPSPPHSLALAEQDSLIIPSSQSDEQDISLLRSPKKKGQYALDTNVQRWRATTSPLRSNATHEPVTAMEDQRHATEFLCGRISPDLPVGDELLHDDRPDNMDVDEPSNNDFCYDGMIHTAYDSDSEAQSGVGHSTVTTAASPRLTAVDDCGLPTPVSSDMPSKSIEHGMDIDEPDRARTGTPSPAHFPSGTPPPAILMRPGTPSVLDANSRTKLLIDNLWARARAKAEQAEESPRKQTYNLDESDDDMVDIFSMVRAAKLNSAPKDTGFNLTGGDSPLTDVDSPGPSRPRHRLTPPDSPSPTHRRALPARTRKAPGKAPTYVSKVTTKAVTSADKGKGKVRANPLRALLAQQERAEKSGRGIVALKRLEAEIRLTSAFEDDDDDFFSSPSQASDGFRLEYGDRLSGSSGSPRDAFDEPLMDHRDRERLLGSKKAKDVDRILKSDLNDICEESADPRELSGIHFWEADIAGRIESLTQRALPALPASCRVQQFAFLSSSVDRFNTFAKENDSGDLQLLSRLVTMSLQSIIPASLDGPPAAGFTDWLLRVALLRDDYLSEIALATLLNSSVVSFGASAIDTLFLLSLFVGLNAKKGILIELGWTMDTLVDTIPTMVLENREQSILKLLQIISAGARMDSLSSCDTSLLLVSVLAVGLDVSTSDQFRGTVVRTTEDIIVSIRDLAQLVKCGEKIVTFGRHLRVQQQTALIEMLSGGDPQVRHLSRWIAYLLVIKDAELSQVRFQDMPPLEPLIAALSPSPSSKSKFVLTPDTNYTELSHSVVLLGAVLTDIDLFVDPKDLVKKSAVQDEPMAPLEHLIDAIHSLHSRIDDVRAAHLERSRTKSVLQSLKARLHHQRLAALETLRPSKKKQDLTSFFTKKADE